MCAFDFDNMTCFWPPWGLGVAGLAWSVTPSGGCRFSGLISFFHGITLELRCLPPSVTDEWSQDVPLSPAGTAVVSTAVRGEVTSIGGKMLTVHTAGGADVPVTLSSTTHYLKLTKSNLDHVAMGLDILVAEGGWSRHAPNPLLLIG
jgi:hypothetical protein